MACAFSLGILLARGAAGGWWWPLAASGACLIIGFLAAAREHTRLAGALALAGFIFAGAANACLFARRFSSSNISHLSEWGLDPNAPLQVEGSVLTDPLRTPYGLQFDFATYRVTLGAGARRVTGKVRLRVPNADILAASGHPLTLRKGDLIRARVRLHRPSRYGNPGDFDYRRWLESVQDITWQGAVTGRRSLEITGHVQTRFLRGLFGRTRRLLLASIDQLYPPWSVRGRTGAILKAVLLGDRSSLDSSTVEGFRKSGLYHLLVVAGLHVGLLIMLAAILLRFIGFREPWRSILLLVFLAIYSGLVEERAATLRASLMIAAYLVARLLDRRQPALNAVGIAALILLLRRPAWLLDSGFQLSFAAALLIAGLAVPMLDRLTEPYRRGLTHLRDVNWDTSFEPRAAQFRLDVRSLAAWLSVRSRLLSDHQEQALRAVALPLRAGLWVAELLIFSAVVQLGLLLPMAEIFHRVTLAGIGLNAVAVPLMTVLLALAVPTVLLNAVWPPLAVLPSKALQVMMKGLLGITNLPRLPLWLSFRVPAPPAWVAWGFALSVIAAAFVLWRRGRGFNLLLVIAGSFALLIAWHPFPARVPAGAFQITALDCGGGESLLAVLPDRSTVLIGAGGGGRGWSGGDPVITAGWDPGENIVSPYLWSQGISSLDVLVAPDDRGGSLLGLASILRNFRVKELWSVPLPGQFAAPLFSLAHDRGVRLRQLSTGALIAYHGFNFRVFWPPRHDGNEPVAAGRSGLLMRISGNGVSLMVARDAGGAAIESVLKSPGAITSTVFQAPRFAPALALLIPEIARVRPRVILAAANGFGGGKEAYLQPQEIPDGPVPEILSPAGQGAVTVTMRAGKVAVRVYRP
ncbi:MAG: ComEC/Rec2 family competence protein [Terriglobia bacterium]